MVIMQNKINRRSFFERSALTAAPLAGMGLLRASMAAAEEQQSDKPKTAATQPRDGLAGDGGTLSAPQVSGSQVDFTIGLARTRTASYPLDSMDFIMMDLERPDGCSRHAHWCTGDLTGRLLEFLSSAEGVDGKSDPRLADLFERILRQRRRSGLFGRYAGWLGASTKEPPENDFRSGAERLFSGLIRYYGLTGDERALDAAAGVAQRIISQKDAWHKHIKATSGKVINAWVTEPFARLYGITKEDRYLDFVGMINEHLGTCETLCHAHGFMSTLRGLQIAAIVTGDKTWNEKPQQNRRIIIDRHFEMPDGCTSECFPSSIRNEGCSIADWLMLNLNAGRICGDDSAYEKAERIFFNALAFNQWITGGFGHRGLTGNGYGLTHLGEAWWCCVHDGGMAMAEYARHAVTFRDATVRINLLVPGRFTIPVPGGPDAEVAIATNYPASAETTIEARNLPADVDVKVRVPGCISQPDLSETRSSHGVRLVLNGKLGHRIEQCHTGVIVTYGPLVLSPSTYLSESPGMAISGDKAVPAGYIPDSLPDGTPSLALGDEVDSDGFLRVDPAPLPEWSYFEEGPGSRCGVKGSTANVPVKFHDGKIKTLRFCPLCYNTSNLNLFETPIVFSGVA